MDEKITDKGKNLIEAVDKNIVIYRKTDEQLEKIKTKITSFLAIIFLIILCSVGLFFNYKISLILFSVYLAVYFSIVSSLKERKLLKAYALARNLVYSDTLDTKALTGRLFGKMNMRYKGACITGEHNNFKTQFFYSSYEQGTSKIKKVYSFTALEITIKDTQFPFILLHKKSRKRHQAVDNFGQDKDIEVHMNAGDNNYSLFTTKNYEIEALQICTPEFTDLIKNSFLPLSVEFAGTHVYIYLDVHLTQERDLDELFRVANALIDHSGNFLVRMRDDYEALHEVYSVDSK